MKLVWKFIFGFSIFLLAQAIMKQEVFYGVIVTVIAIASVYKLGGR